MRLHPPTRSTLKMDTLLFIAPAMFLAIAFLFPVRSSATASIAIGVLEETVTPNDTNNELPGGLRILFKKAGRDWQTLCDSNTAQCNFSSAGELTDWYVQYNGKRLATIQTSGLPGSSSSDIGFLKIATALVPIVGEKSNRWSNSTNTPVHRPLVATSVPLNPTPHIWKQTASDASSIRMAWPLFHKNIPAVELCVSDKSGNLSKSKSRATTLNDIEIDQTWLSAQRGRLIHVQIKPEIGKDCDWSIDADTQLWLHQLPNGKLFKLPAQAGEVIHPVDFGDFGNDHQEAALFQLKGNNEGGYVLYYNNFRARAKLSWAYH